MSKKTSPAQAELVDEIEYPFAQIPTAFLEAAKGKAMSNHARWLFVLLRGYLNRASKVAFPSYDRIREDTSWAYDTISKALKELEDTGWLSRQKRFGDSTIYRLHFPKSSPERSTVAKSFRIKSSVSPNLGQIESNHRKVINHVLGDVDTPHTPSQSFEGEEPFSLLANSPNSKLKSVQVTLAPDQPQWEQSSDVVSPYDPSLPKPLTVHASGGSATPPEYAGAPPSAQAAVFAPAQTAQLRVLSPASDLTGITASIEAVDPPSTPVSAKTSRQPRKAKIEKTAEELQISAGVTALMTHIHDRMGKIERPGAQGAKCKEMLKAGHSVERIKQELEIQLKELINHKRRIVNWMTVSQTITSSVFAEQQPQTKLGGLNTNGKSNRGNFFDYINSKPFQQY